MTKNSLSLILSSPYLRQPDLVQPSDHSISRSPESSESETRGFHNAPTEILLEIFKHLSLQDRLSASLTCRHWATTIFRWPGADLKTNHLSLDFFKNNQKAQALLLELSHHHYFHVNAQLTKLFKKHLQTYYVSSSFPDLLLTTKATKRIADLETEISEVKKKSHSVLIYIYTELQRKQLVPAIAPDSPNFIAKIVENLRNSREVQSLKELEIKPPATASREVYLPEELSVLQNLESITINAEHLGSYGVDSHAQPYFIPEATLFLLPGISELLKLKHIKIAFFKEVSSLPIIPSLESLIFKGCRTMEKLPTGIDKQSSLRKLWISGCTHLATIPDKMGDLIELKITLSGITTLPQSLVNLTGLVHFEMNSCPHIFEIRDTSEIILFFRKIASLPEMKEFKVFGELYSKMIKGSL